MLYGNASIKSVSTTPEHHDAVVDELFSGEESLDTGGDDEQLPPLRPSFY